MGDDSVAWTTTAKDWVRCGDSGQDAQGAGAEAGEAAGVDCPAEVTRVADGQQEEEEEEEEEQEDDRVREVEICDPSGRRCA